MTRRVALLCVLAASCGSALAGGEEAPSATTSTTTTSAPATSTTFVATSTTLVPVAEAAAAPAPRFGLEIGAVTAEELGPSWREGCPVGPEDLRRLDLTHWDERGGVAQGELIVHADHAEAVGGVFAALFEAGFPIHSMRPVADFGADDDASMAANNSSGFNCRSVAGTDRWSEHAFGTAIDLNPLVNPYVRGSQVDPPGGAAFTDRTVDVPGMIVDDDLVVTAFARIGWVWGGDWSSARDYQHFSASGR